MKLNLSIFKPFWYFGLGYLLLGFTLRLVLLFHPITTTSFTSFEILKIFGIGLLNDCLVFVLLYLAFMLYYLFLSNGKYRKPWGNAIFLFLVFILAYISFFNTVLNEYGGSLPEIVITFVSIKVFFFGLLLFLPKQRQSIRKGIYFFSVFLFSFILVQNAVSEFFFWNEFGLRYNFIAVDYLVYTNAVLGNIVESYPVIPIFIAVGIVSLALAFWVFHKTNRYLDQLPSFRDKGIAVVLYSGLCALALYVIPWSPKWEGTSNIFSNELQSNGNYKFFQAFVNSELDYFKFYPVLSESKLQSILNANHLNYAEGSTLRVEQNTGPELRKNVVLITIESLSSDFMKYYGNQENITPFLDSLANESLFFTQVYATGNRTVRGLEAVSLSIPPSPGESVVKRIDNKNKFTTGSVFKSKGYQVNYIYGGDSYFDNMKDFFSHNQYQIVDQKSFSPSEVSFENIWGVCDEDLFAKAIQVMNRQSQTDQPFFNHIMTVSNHRPFTYPDGKIDIPADSKSRAGGVKYTDYALKQFFKAAKEQTWFANTVFVIVSDHCASSAGKTELPLDKYRIPAWIYAPGFVAAGENHTLISQIDLMPTAMGLLNWSYPTKFYGQDVLKSTYIPRAFIATYQDLGYLKNQTLTILSPNRKIQQFNYDVQANTQLKASLVSTPKVEQHLVDEATAFYQAIATQLQNQKYQDEH